MRLNRILMINMAGDDVSFMQSKLKEGGFFKENVDGNFGQNTLISVTNFQKFIGVKADGVVGMMTWNKLSEHIENQPTPKPVNNPLNIIQYKSSFVGHDGFAINDCILGDDDYIKSETKKETIWIGHTNGGSRPDWTINGWQNDFERDKKGNFTFDKIGNKIPIKVASAYVVGRKSSSSGSDLWDGKILRAFDDKYWAYSLSLDSPRNGELNSKSISIEICNYGALTIGKDGTFYNCVNKPIMESEVTEVDFGGYKYWEKYTDSQLESTRRLILFIKNKWGIEIQSGIYNETWFDFNKTWLENGGIRSKSQLDKSKFDIFPQKEMMQMLDSL